MEDLINFIRDSFSTKDLLQGIVVAFFATLMLRRYGLIIQVTLIAALFDMILVPLGMAAMDGLDMGELPGVASGLVMDVVDDLEYFVLRLAFLFLSITFLYGLKSAFRRIG